MPLKQKKHVIKSVIFKQKSDIWQLPISEKSIQVSLPTRWLLVYMNTNISQGSCSEEMTDASQISLTQGMTAVCLISSLFLDLLQDKKIRESRKQLFFLALRATGNIRHLTKQQNILNFIMYSYKTDGKHKTTSPLKQTSIIERITNSSTIDYC